MKGTNTWECMSFRHHAVLKKQIRCLSDLSQGVVCSVVLLDDANSMLKANSAVHADAKLQLSSSSGEQRRPVLSQCRANTNSRHNPEVQTRKVHMTVFGPHVTGETIFLMFDGSRWSTLCSRALSVAQHVDCAELVFGYEGSTQSTLNHV